MARILLVEDDPSLREDLCAVLEKEGYLCDACESIAFARQHLPITYSLYILDVLLPDGSGIQLCRELRANHHAPVLFLTACDDEISTVNGLDAGGDGYVTKPFRLKELLSRIRAMLRRASAELEDCLMIGDLKIHSKERRAYHSDILLPLTKTEMDLLLLFVQHPSQVLTRGQILQRLWDDGGDFVDDNTLSVHISHLREKVKSLPLTTVRGIGYMLDANPRRVML